MQEFPDDHAHHHRPRTPRAAPARKPKPKDVLCVRRRTLVASLAAAAFAGLIVGGSGGVVFSPDQRAVAAPSPSLDVVAIQGLIDQAILIYHIHDHGLEGGSPSPPTSSPSPSSTITAIPTVPARAAPASTARPTPRPTARPAPTAPPAPSAAPCFRPGNPQSGHDPCDWPPDDK